jgi:hypothetical protein
MNEEAIHYIIHFLRERPATKYSSYGYDFYLPGIIQHYAEKHEGLEEQNVHHRKIELSPYFYAAAWELCRRTSGTRNKFTWPDPDCHTPIASKVGLKEFWQLSKGDSKWSCMRSTLIN